MPSPNEPLSCPPVSVIIPTHNSQHTLANCLAALTHQSYPRSRFEIIIVDGGSKDNTVRIAEGYGIDKLIYNPANTEEQGKSLGIKQSEGELIAFLDADNYVVSSHWLERMVEPFGNPAIVASEPLYYTSEKGDPVIARYCSLVGSDDPFYNFLGYYDRYCVFKENWTQVPVSVHDEGNYLRVRLLDPKRIPTMGANGFIIRAQYLDTIGNQSLVHTDLIYDLVKAGKNDFAKVKIGIKHDHATNLASYTRKKMRRARRYASSRSYNEIPSTSMARFALLSCSLIQLAFETVRGYKRAPDVAWLLHMVLPLIITMTYGLEFVKQKTSVFA